MHGGQVYDKGFTKSLMDQPNAVSGLQHYYDQGFGALKYAPTSSTSHRSPLNPTFGDGKLGMSSMPPSTIPVLRASRSAVIRMRWSSKCRAPRERRTCRLPSIRPGQSRSVTLVSEPRRRPRTIRIELSAEGKDLKPADNVKVLRVRR